MSTETKNRPIKVFTCGAVKAAIWSDSKIINNALVEMHSIKIDRSYKDKATGQWKNTSSFNVEDLPKIAALASEAYKFIRIRDFDDRDT